MRTNLKVKAEEKRTIQEVKEFDFESIEIEFKIIRGHTADGKIIELEKSYKHSEVSLIITDDGIEYPELIKRCEYNNPDHYANIN